MKKKYLNLCLILSTLVLLVSCGKKPTDILIVYFSNSGNTEKMAEIIQKETGGDIFRIEPLIPYPADMAQLLYQTRLERDAGTLPPLKENIADIGKYNTVFVGSPNWHGSIASHVASFSYLNDFKGKTIVPFSTYNTDGGNSLEDIGKLFFDSSVLKGLAVKGSDVEKNKAVIKEWIEGLGLENSGK